MNFKLYFLRRAQTLICSVMFIIAMYVGLFLYPLAEAGFRTTAVVVLCVWTALWILVSWEIIPRLTDKAYELGKKRV